MALVDYSPVSQSATPRSGVGPILSVAVPVFTGAFLLFQVQPLLARRILPWFGGGASVWTACMLFFQVALLAGYLYAHWAVRNLTPRALALVHSGLLAVSLLALPVVPAEAWKPADSGEPIARILLLLTATVGLPYFALSSTSPIMQAVFARRWPHRSPYRLFALSNVGSLLGLLAYPVAVEPFLALSQQGIGWSAVYAVYAVAAAGAVWAARGTERLGAVEESAPLPCHGTQSSWLLLPAVASVLLLAATGYVTQNVAPTPFLWILPLTAYLLSFVVAFDAERWYRPHALRRLSWLVLLLMSLPFHSPQLLYNVPVVATVSTLAVFIIGWYCHGETVRRKPHPAHLTRFYLMMSAGGALGGLLVGIVSPLIVPAQIEYLMALMLASATLVVRSRAQTKQEVRMRVVFALSLVMILVAAVRNGSQGMVEQVRSFYGSLFVSDDGKVKSLGHGVVIHGTQILAEPRASTSYYGVGSGIHAAIELTRRPGHRVGLVGLGAGTLAAYGRKGDRYTFYEINPQVVDLAQRHFTFLKDSPASVDIVVGDGRLALEREAPRGFDLLVVDAFSGDSIPVHLLTVEALTLYRRHLAPGGVIAFHISNSVLDLAPVVGGLARSAGMRSVDLNVNGDDKVHRSSSEWALLAPEGVALPQGPPAPVRDGMRVWTDDYSSLWPILR